MIIIVMVRLTTRIVNGSFSAVVHYRSAVFPNLHSRDITAVEHAIANSPQHPNEAKKPIRDRKVVIPLEHPFKFENKEFRAVRLKGVKPRVESGIAFPHNGMGFDDKPIIISENGVASIGVPHHEPEGGQSKGRVQAEFETAVILGIPATQLILGYGLYANIAYEGSNTGFNIYALKAERDTRFDDLSGWDTLNPDFAILFYKFGRALAIMHKKGFYHGYPHLGNGAITKNGPMRDWEVLLSDLDTAKKLADMTPKQRFGYLLLDICYAIEDINLGDSFTSEMKSEYSKQFIEGYFEEAINTGDFELVQQLRGFLRDGGIRDIDLFQWAFTQQDMAIRFIAERLARKALISKEPG